jgi:hypothetical protein
MNEPIVTINGTTLNTAQAMTLRVAVTDFLTMISNVGELGEDQTGEEIRQGYAARSSEIVSLMLSPAAPSLAIDTEAMDRAWRTWIETSDCRTAVGHFAFAAVYAAAKDATPPPSSHVVGDLDYCFDPENWEFTCSWPERDQVHGYGESLKPGQPMRVCTLLKGPDKWVADVPITWDEEGEPDETEIRWFDSEEEARAALATTEDKDNG